VLHSFHYPGRKIGRGKGEYEQYARDVALALDGLHLDGILVKESPIKRYFPRLLKKYKADWALDLHDDIGGIDWLTQPWPICCVNHAWPDEPSRQNDVAWQSKVKKVKTILHDFTEQVYGFKLGPPYTYILENREPPFYSGPASGSLDPRVLGIELYTRRPFEQSLDFVKRLSNYLQGESL
jgi:hypothetical protein